MDIKEEKMCRICLKSPIEDFEIINDTTENIFRTLSFEINLSISEELVMCKSCAECLRKCFDFKASYMCVEDRIASFSSSKGGIVVDLTELYLRECTNTDGIISRDYNICRFCLQCINNHMCTSLDVLNENLVMARGKLAAYVPEMDLTVTDSPVICSSCLESLQSYEAFRMICWDTEEKIKQFCEAKGIDKGSRLKLSDVTEFFFKWTLNEDCVKKETEEVGIETVTNATWEEMELGIKTEENENTLERSSSTRYSPSDDTCETEAKKLLSNTPTFTPKKLVHYKCKDCPFETHRKFNYQRHIRTHLPKHKPPMAVILFKCDFCPFETHRKFNYERHVRTHKSITEIVSFDCVFCNYKAKEKSLLNRHMLIHKDKSEITIYRCEFCLYEGKRKDELKQHMQVHERRSSEATLHECAHCAFKTEQKSYLGLHVEPHVSDASTKTVYKCEVCMYETSFSCHLIRHKLIHKDKLKVKWYKCDKCAYETKQRYNLKRHFKVHTGESSKDGAVYKCETCGYETKQKSHLKRHMQVHQK